jgi:hypothetical protein
LVSPDLIMTQNVDFACQTLWRLSLLSPFTESPSWHFLRETPAQSLSTLGWVNLPVRQTPHNKPN